MNIITNSIKDDLEIQLNKPIEEITQQDLLNVKSIIIDRLNYKENINDVNYDDILYFNNLEDLSIFNCMINKKLMDNILTLKNLKVLNIYNSDFVDYIYDWFSMMNIDKLTISNCIGISDITLSNIKYLQLKNINVNFPIENINILDISSTTTNIEDLKFNNIGKIIISYKNYNQNTNFENIGTNITIIDDKMNIIREIKND